MTAGKQEKEKLPGSPAYLKLKKLATVFFNQGNDQFV